MTVWHTGILLNFHLTCRCCGKTSQNVFIFRLRQWHYDHILLEDVLFRLCDEARSCHSQVLSGVLELQESSRLLELELV